MPREHRNRKVRILCNDCNIASKVKYCVICVDFEIDVRYRFMFWGTSVGVAMGITQSFAEQRNLDGIQALV